MNVLVPQNVRLWRIPPCRDYESLCEIQVSRFSSEWEMEVGEDLPLAPITSTPLAPITSTPLAPIEWLYCVRYDKFIALWSAIELKCAFSLLHSYRVRYECDKLHFIALISQFIFFVGISIYQKRCSIIFGGGPDIQSFYSQQAERGFARSMMVS